MNSDRYSPTPSAPYSFRYCEIFEQLDVGFEPDPDAVGGRDRARLAVRQRRGLRGRVARRCASSIMSGVGATTSSPVVPSRITGVPAAMRSEASCRPTIAGTFSERARIAV